MPSDRTPTASRSAPSIRARVRAEMADEIKAIARRHLASGGANLSLRAVARDLGVVSSALYRYFPSRDDLIERYAASTGADLSNLAYYRTFNSFKTACILHGVYARYRAGQKSTEGVDIETLFARIGLSLDAAEERATGID